MRHRKSSDFRQAYDALPANIRELADKCFELLKADLNHPSIRFKKIGPYWAARVGLHYRALAVQRPYGFLWVWIDPHDEYERLIS